MSARPGSVHRRLSRSGPGCFVALAFLAGCHAVGVLPAGGATTAFAFAGVSRAELDTGAEYQTRRWENNRGNYAASQLLLPVDVTWRARRIRMAAGADFARSDIAVPDGTVAAVTPGEFRAASDFSFSRDRLRVAAGTRVPFAAAGLGPAEARTAEVLDEVALGFPRARHPGGPRLLMEAGVQPVRRPDLLVQTGLAYEARGSYQVLADGRRLSPGDPWRLAAGIRTGRGSVTGDFGLCWEKVGESRLDGGYRFREGSALTVRGALQRQFDRDRIDFAGAFSVRASGWVQAGAPLDASSLRGGNALRLMFSGSRAVRAGEVGLSLGLLGVRGYAGDLGHAGALEPGVFWAPDAAGGRLRLALRGMIGRCRDDHPLRGLDVSLSWQRGWQR